jgi:hypothetical protein
MGVLKLSCDEAIEFCQQQQFKFMKKFKKFVFLDDAFRVKLIMLSRPNIKVEFYDLSRGILTLRIRSKNLLFQLGKLFNIIKKAIKKELDKGKGKGISNLNQCIFVEKKGGVLYLKIEIDNLLDSKLKGITIKNIRLRNKEIIVDF